VIMDPKTRKKSINIYPEMCRFRVITILMLKFKTVISNFFSKLKEGVISI